MGSLRGRLVRLAYDRPDLRARLLRMATAMRQLTVELGAAPNPDFAGEPDNPNGHIRIREHLVHVHSLAEAARVCTQFIDRNGLGGGNWTGGKVRDDAGRTVAQVSYNGRVWPPGRWTPGTRELTDADLPPIRVAGVQDMERTVRRFDDQKLRDALLKARAGGNLAEKAWKSVLEAEKARRSKTAEITPFIRKLQGVAHDVFQHHLNKPGFPYTVRKVYVETSENHAARAIPGSIRVEVELAEVALAGQPIQHEGLEPFLSHLTGTARPDEAKQVLQGEIIEKLGGMGQVGLSHPVNPDVRMHSVIFVFAFTAA